MAEGTPPLIDRLAFGWGGRTPVVLQTEASECGLACLAMVMAHHGAVTDLPTLRSRHGTAPQGLTVVDLVRMAGEERMTCRAVRAEPAELEQLRLPCILHWDMSHFVVLHKTSGGRCEVLDPAIGARTLGGAEVSARFSGVAIEIWPDQGFRKRDEAQRISLVQLVGRITGLWRTLWRVMSASLGLEILALVSPLFLQAIVDHVVRARDLNLLTTLAAGFLFLLLVEQLLGAMRSFLLLRVGTELRVQWRSNVLQHLLRLPLDYFSRRHLGDVISRFGSINRIQQVLTNTFVEAALDGLMVILGVVLMLLYSPALTAVAVTSVLAYGLVRWAWYGPLRTATAERLVRSANESSHLLETVRGIRAIRLFSRHAERMAAWQTLMVSDVNASLQIQRLEIIYRLIRRTLSGVFTLLILWLGARLVMSNQMSLGMLLAFIAYRSQFDSRASELINKWFELRMLGLDAQRLADIVLTPAEATGRPPVGTLPTAPPRVEIEGLKFRYSVGGPPILDNLNLTIEAGQSIAIAGPSGGGKTTLVQLLLGVYTPDAGSIRVDGSSLQEMGLDRWRAQVGTVMQDDVLFAGAISDNISFFDSRPDSAWIEECARMAAIHDDIVRLPMGYQTLVGDMGSALSGGQKQRILLARALYRRPRLLLLDEATSHLDLACEAQVGRSVAAMSLTRIVVAHRPQTLAAVDRVVELRDGHIVRDESALAYRRRVVLQEAGSTA
jgi:ATP-binding cassette, subfamily B, bacterial CvaB/MchF/RaxB